MRILLVAADPYLALVEEMQRLGHVATIESDPVEAGRVLARERLDVLGVEAARLAADARWLEPLRANAAPGLMMLGLASSHEEAELAPLLAAGVDEYLVAPFAPAEVRVRLTLLAQRRAASVQALGERGEGEVALDITQRKQAEAALRRSEESFRALIEGSPEAILVHRGGPLLYVNPLTVRLLGLPAFQLVGTSVLQYVHPEDRDMAAGLLDVPPGQVRPGASELRFVQPNGRVMTAEVSCLSIVFQGEPATVVSARDLTDRKQMQARLVLSDRLAAMGTLAAGVAHEINNPLSFVISNLSFLANELRALSGEVAPGRMTELEEVLREAAMGANRVRQIVADLKTFSRADDDVPTAVNLQNVIDSALTIARAELRARARVVRDYVEVPPVEGSEGRLGQVFLNLLINAAQAIPAGQPEDNEIRVTLRAVQGHVVAEVRDTGAGIPPEMRSRIFDPFFTTKPVGVGTGLGLFVCQGIVTRFGGEISVESELGQGTTFRVIFPVARRFQGVRLTPVPLPGQGGRTRA